MELNADRLAKLAGLKVNARESLNEASNRSYHDGDNSDEADYRFGKNQLAEGEEDKEVEEAHCSEADEQEEAMMYEKDDEDLVEIDEGMLAEEIAKMRQERLQENELRSIIRNEVASIVSQMKKTKKEESASGSKATNGITKGFTGPGF